jgi:hypothetical protein
MVEQYDGTIELVRYPAFPVQPTAKIPSEVAPI